MSGRRRVCGRCKRSRVNQPLAEIRERLGGPVCFYACASCTSYLESLGLAAVWPGAAELEAAALSPPPAAPAAAPPSLLEEV